jgi:hypothetical protein
MTNEDRLARINALAAALRVAALEKPSKIGTQAIISACNIIEMYCKFPAEHLSMASALFDREMNFLSPEPDPDKPQ